MKNKYKILGVVLFMLIYVGIATCIGAKSQSLFMMQDGEKVMLNDILIVNEPTTVYYEVPDKVARVECKINEELISMSYHKPATFEITPDMTETTYENIRFIAYDAKNKVISKTNYLLKAKKDIIYPDRAARKVVSEGMGGEIQYSSKYIPILMYHDVVPEEQINNQSIQVSTALFEKQLQALINEGYTPINFYDYYRYMAGEIGLPKKPILITFDDGYLSNYTYAYPIMKKLGVQATYFIATSYVGEKTYEMDHFTWDEASEMEQSGLIDIQSHTHTHRNMSELGEQSLTIEYTKSFEMIEANLGKRDVRVLSYPQFKNSKNARKIAQTFNIALQVTDLATSRHLSNYPTELRRIHVHNQLSSDELIRTIQKLTK